MLESWFKQYGLTYHVHDPYPTENLTHCQTIDQKYYSAVDRVKSVDNSRIAIGIPDVPPHPIVKNDGDVHTHVATGQGSYYKVNLDLTCWGGEELDLNKYKPYVIYVYSKPECSIWSKCTPTHWQALQVDQDIIERVCNLMNIPYKKEICSISRSSIKYPLKDFNPASNCDIPGEVLIFDHRTENGPNKVNSIKYLNLDYDHLNYERFFYNYACVSKSYDILLLNYHHLWENLEPLFDYCGIPLEDIQKFPRQRVPSWEKTIRYWDSPTSTWEEQEYSGPELWVEKAHNGMFKVLNGAINKLPKLGVNPKHNNNKKGDE